MRMKLLINVPLQVHFHLPPNQIRCLPKCPSNFLIFGVQKHIWRGNLQILKYRPVFLRRRDQKRLRLMFCDVRDQSINRRVIPSVRCDFLHPFCFPFWINDCFFMMQIMQRGAPRCIRVLWLKWVNWSGKHYKNAYKTSSKFKLGLSNLVFNAPSSINNTNIRPKFETTWNIHTYLVQTRVGRHFGPQTSHSNDQVWRSGDGIQGTKGYRVSSVPSTRDFDLSLSPRSMFFFLPFSIIIDSEVITCSASQEPD